MLIYMENLSPKFKEKGVIWREVDMFCVATPYAFWLWRIAIYLGVEI